jgi:PEP-CTERM motif
MQGNSYSILRVIGVSLFTMALVMLAPTVSHVAPPNNHPPPHDQHHRVSVPEPSTEVLLLIGLGVTGLVRYVVRRRKRGA